MPTRRLSRDSGDLLDEVSARDIVEIGVVYRANLCSHGTSVTSLGFGGEQVIVESCRYRALAAEKGSETDGPTPFDPPIVPQCRRHTVRHSGCPAVLMMLGLSSSPGRAHRWARFVQSGQDPNCDG